jgi:nitrogen fixation protein FixH
MSHPITRPSLWRPLTGRKFAFLLVASFGLVFAVNGIFVYYALTSWSGLTDDGSYVSGLHYNQTLAEARAQEALGWTSDLRYDGHRFEIRLRQQTGEPVTGRTVSLAVIRPVHQGEDFSLKTKESSPGLYTADRVLSGAGRWTAEVVVNEGEAVRYRLNHDLMVSP